MALPSSGQLGGTPTNAQFATYIEAFRDVVSNQIGGAGRYELTIASGAVTPPARDHGGVFRLDTEGNAASDTLDTITQTNTPDGTVIVLMAEDAARVVTLNHAAGGSGQILLTDSTDFVFASLNAWVMLQRRSTDWVELMRWVPPTDLSAQTTLASTDLVRLATSGGVEKSITGANLHTTLAGLVLLDEQTAAAAASVEFTSVITSSYVSYVLVCEGVYSATDSVALQLLASGNNGSSYVAANYKYKNVLYGSGGSGATEAQSGSASAAQIASAISNAAADAGEYVIDLQNDATAGLRGHWRGAYITAGGNLGDISGALHQPTSTNAIKLQMSSGNITGTFRLYGRRKS